MGGLDAFSSSEKIVKALNNISRSISDMDKTLHELSHEVHRVNGKLEDLLDAEVDSGSHSRACLETGEELSKEEES